MTIPRQRLLLPIVSLAMAASAAAQILPAPGQFSAAPSVSLMLQGFSPENPPPRDGAEVLLDFKDNDVKFSLASMMEILRDHRHEGWVLAAYPDPKTGECTQISTAFNIEAIPAFVLHQPGDTTKTKTAQAAPAGHQAG